MKSIIWSTMALMVMVAMAPAVDAGSESPADKLKREKAEKAAQDKLDADKAELEAKAKAEEEAIKRDNEILAQKQAEADAKSAADDARMKEHEAKVAEASRLAVDDDTSDGEDEPALRPGQTRLASVDSDDREAAIKNLETIALSYPLTTPDSHVIFGFGGVRFTVGELRSIFNLRRS
jgi:vacuolar-type H+-ATPase subunit I/STV1